MPVMWRIQLCASRELIEEKLKETDMWKVYQRYRTSAGVYLAFHGTVGNLRKREKN